MILIGLSFFSVLTAGDDSVFSDRLRIEVDSMGDDHDAGVHNDNRPHNPMMDTGDSGVGPSPRSPRFRTLGDTSLPPPWLQDVCPYINTYFSVLLQPESLASVFYHLFSFLEE